MTYNPYTIERRPESQEDFLVKSSRIQDREGKFWTTLGEGSGPLTRSEFMKTTGRVTTLHPSKWFVNNLRMMDGTTLSELGF